MVTKIFTKRSNFKKGNKNAERNMLKVLIRKGYRNLNTIPRSHISKKEYNKYLEFHIISGFDVHKSTSMGIP